jgi:hypothetical protein
MSDALTNCQGGGAATQMPAEHYHSGSNPDLGFYNIMQSSLKIFEVFRPMEFLIVHQAMFRISSIPVQKFR